MSCGVWVGPREDASRLSRYLSPCPFLICSILYEEEYLAGQRCVQFYSDQSIRCQQPRMPSQVTLAARERAAFPGLSRLSSSLRCPPYSYTRAKGVSILLHYHHFLRHCFGSTIILHGYDDLRNTQLYSAPPKAIACTTPQRRGPAH